MLSGTALFLGLFNNLAIFIILVSVYGILNSYFKRSAPFARQLSMGICFGFFAIGCMYVKIPVADGVIVDQRNTIVALSGVFGGPLAAVCCAVMAGAFRAYLGGAGVLGGVIGVTLAATAGTGLHLVRNRIESIWMAVIGALVATLVILPGFLFVGDWQKGWTLLKAMTIPYGGAIFLGILLVGLLLAHEEHRQTAQLEREKSEKRYREIFENLIDVSFRTDSQGYFTVLSPSVKKMFGYSPEEAQGIQIGNFFRASERRTEFVKLLQQTGRVENFEAEIRKKDGTFVWVSTNAKMIQDVDGGFAGAEGVARDISRLKKAEQEKAHLEESLRQSQKMEAIGTLAGGIAHDFNNILHAVIGYTEIVLDRIPKGSKDRENLESVILAALRARELTKQILMFSRKSKPEKSTVQLVPVIEEAVKLLKQTIPATITINCDLNLPKGAMQADPTQMHQIMLNLGTNAYHALKNEEGRIDIGLTSVQFYDAKSKKHSRLKAGKYALLTVSDSGDGIAPSIISRIFEPFFTTKEHGKGTGMGLSVVHGIVTDHDGVIEVESQPGKGTTFKVFLPIFDMSDNPNPTAATSLPTGTEKILLVDDDKALIRLGEAVFVGLGYTVFATTSVRQALERFRGDPDAFDLIITDQTMPEMTGDQFAKEVMCIRPEIPIILCTGFSAVFDAQKANTAGIKAFLMKPIDRNQYAHTVRSVLDNALP